MKLSCSLLAALAILGQTAVAAVASRLFLLAVSVIGIPIAPQAVRAWASEDKPDAPALANQISVTVTRTLAFSYGTLKWYLANGVMNIRIFSG
ncbi:hypothetical protein A7D00_4930 [Trichophyton violaceum]|uniref:Uncharacterized protein n=1 Tax=Trichophyton violaceum TaxID=34388 RepID=A0A178FDD9_TRIVO|nr:hypothetical protein A7D00_4930 [Trichophyton violaceum]